MCMACVLLIGWGLGNLHNLWPGGGMVFTMAVGFYLELGVGHDVWLKLQMPRRVKLY